MNALSITIFRDELERDFVRFLTALDPADLPRLAAAVRLVAGFPAELARLLAGTEAPAVPVPAADPDLARRVAVQGELLDRLADEVAELHAFAHAGPGPLDELAAVPPVAVATPAADPTREDDPHETPGPHPAGPEPTPEPVEIVPPRPAAPSANGTHHADAGPGPRHDAPAKRRARQLGIARLLANGPAKGPVIRTACGIPMGTFSSLLDCAWFARGDGYAPEYRLTDAGRAALAAEGYVVPPAAPETIPADPETIAAAGAPADPRPELSAKERAVEQVKLIAQTICDSAEALTADEISRRAGLPLELVRNRLQHNGPNTLSTFPQYFCRGTGEPSLWRLSNSGRKLIGKD